MSERDDSSPEVPESPAPSQSAATPAPEAPAKRSFRDRFVGFGERLRTTRGLIAVTLAALIVGGFGGAAIHAAVGGDRHEHGRHFGGERPGERSDFGERPGQSRDFYRQAPPGFPGQVPPTTTPSPTPSESSDS